MFDHFMDIGQQCPLKLNITGIKLHINYCFF